RLSFAHPFLALAREHLERIPTCVLARAKKILNAGSVHNLISEPNKMINHLPNLMQIVVAGELATKESDLIFIHTRTTNATAYPVYPPEPFKRYGWDRSACDAVTSQVTNERGLHVSHLHRGFIAWAFRAEAPEGWII